jgi:hypothetical protein
LVLAACGGGTTAEAPGTTPTSAGETAQLFAGLYAAGPELSSFVPCALGELPGPGQGYWLIPNEEFSQLLEDPGGITIAEIAGTYGPYDVFAIYVRFEGILSEEAGQGYGPSGLYRGEVRVTKALEASRQWVGSTYPQERYVGCGP